MSASLQTHDAHTFAMIARLDSLTTLNPSADDLRTRATFWRKYADGLVDDGRAYVAEHVRHQCDAMDRTADRMENPEPVATLITTRAPETTLEQAAEQAARTIATVTTKPPRKARATTPELSAFAFWRAADQARRNAGAKWYLDPDTFLVTLPTKLCGHTTERGTRIKWRRDQRFPAAKYWPGGQLPNGITPAVNVNSTWDHEAALTRVEQARVDQICQDRIFYARRDAPLAIDNLSRQETGMDKIPLHMRKHAQATLNEYQAKAIGLSSI